MSASSRGSSSSGLFVPPIVGREHEIRIVRGVLDRLSIGRGQLLLMSGEPGIGKSRLAGLLAEEAAPRSRVVWGRSHGWDGAPPYWPWVEMLRDLAISMSDERLSTISPHDIDHLSQLIPELSLSLGAATASTPTPPEQARFQLFDAVRHFLLMISQSQPLVLILEDVHWADASSFLLLQFVAQRIETSRIGIVATFRDPDADLEHDSQGIHADLARLPWASHIRLRGLSQRDIGVLAELVSGPEVVPTLVESIAKTTGGNPFYVVETLRLLSSYDWPDDVDRSRAHQLPIPHSVRQVIRQRLRHLPADALELLEVAAVVGREFSIALLADIVDQSIDRLVALLDSLVAAGLVHDTDTPGVFQFNHALTEATVYADLSLPRRMDIHGRVAMMLEKVAGDDQVASAAVLAHHFREASPLLGCEKATRYSIEAGERATAQFAWDVAVEQYRHTVRLLDSRGSSDRRQLCDILLRLGDVQNRATAGRPRTTHAQQLGAGGSPGGRETFLRAAYLAREANFSEQLAWAALGVGGFNPHTLQGGVEGLRLLEDALERLPTGDSALRSRLLARAGAEEAMLARYGVLHLTPDRQRRVIQRVDEAIAIARRGADDDALAFALVMFCLQYELRPAPERVSAATEILDLSAVSGNLEYTAWGLSMKRIALLQNNDWSEVQHVGEAAVVDERLRMPYFRWNTAIAEAGAALRDGRFAEAAGLIDESNQLQPVSGTGTMQLIALRREVGPVDDLVELVDRFRGNIPRSSRYWAFRIVCLAEMGRIAEARQELATRVHSQQCREELSLRPLSLLAEACWMVDDRERARILVDRLGIVPDIANVLSEATDYTGGAVAYYRGLLATVLRQWDEAERRFALAEECHLQWQMQPMVAHTCYAWAEMLTRRGATHRDDATRRLLERVLTLTDELGMVRLAEKAQSLLAQLDSCQTRSTPIVPNLSPREIEVLQLVARGLSDRDIADTLYISPRTVTTHVSHILAKLGVRTRTEATALAIRAHII